jgi:cytochrome c-type biogenesis protein
MAALALVFVLAGCGEGGAEGDQDGADEAARALEPQPAPAYQARTLDGDSVTLAELRGEVVLLNVWATWCVPCRQEIPELQALYEEHADRGLRVVGVTVDSRSAEEQVQRFIQDFGMTYEVWVDPDQTAVSTFEAIGVPLTVLVDRDGRIVWRHLGAFQRGDPELVRAVETALGVASNPAQSSTE